MRVSRTEIPSKGEEIERRRCNLSLIPKPGPVPTKGDTPDAAPYPWARGSRHLAVHDEPGGCFQRPRTMGGSSQTSRADPGAGPPSSAVGISEGDSHAA